jgi:polyhydroxyalkanoate synthesis regulator phasin
MKGGPVAEEIVVAAKEPKEKEKPAPDASPPLDEADNHYSTLHARLNEALRDFRAAGENIGLLLVENIKFNRDRLAEYVDRFEEQVEAMPPTEEMQKFLDGIESVRTELTKHSQGIDEKIKTSIAAAFAEFKSETDTIQAQIAEVRSQRQAAQRDPTVEATAQTVEMLRGQLIDLNNRLSGLHERQQLADEFYKRELTTAIETGRSAIAAGAALEGRVEALERKVNGST